MQAGGDPSGNTHYGRTILDEERLDAIPGSKIGADAMEKSRVRNAEERHAEI